ncbi:MAG: chemotaxis response regulator protein-glutamate methylesterase [Bryobacteraceae bacterium]|nr:chemotaxis response regulator protein-glutamate methylesterase [Bryobacteraceae bacterium]
MNVKSRKILLPGQKIRALVVDDSVVIRRLVSHALEADPGIEVVGVAAHGGIALQRIPQLNPDVVTLDVEMPEMDGLETLRYIRRDYPELRVVMFSTLTERGGLTTLEALSLGADDYVTKASNEGSLDRSMVRLREELIPKLRQFFQPPGPVPDHSARLLPRPPAPAFAPRSRILTIGVSTGGPNALGLLLPEIPAGFPLPVLVVQHMPPLFTRLLAERLNACCQLRVKEAECGELFTPGTIYVAPGDRHLRFSSTGRAELDDGPPMNSCRPAVDALWLSLASVCAGAVTAVVLTGMGQDGLRGATALKAQGARIIAQDEASSVVWGMPGAVVHAGLADHVLPLDRIAEEIWQAA